MSTPTSATGIAARYKTELPSMGVMLAILAVLAFFHYAPYALVGGMAVCVLAAPLFPARFSWLASLCGFGLLAAVAYFYYDAPQMATALAIIGVILAATSYFSKGRI